MTHVKKVKNELTVPLKRRDNLISSDYTDVPVFMPSYQKNCEKTNMFYLMSMEYQQIWTKEKDEYLKSRAFNAKKVKKVKKIRVPTVQQETVREKITEKPPLKNTTKYDHIQSKYKIRNQPVCENKK
jgi:hypothetical protein|uniref:Uncharacterized protein n=1 Tax=Sipha flava TaxID=143950 RepID=A0A2S2R4T8_9HEMI